MCKIKMFITVIMLANLPKFGVPLYRKYEIQLILNSYVFARQKERLLNEVN